MILSMIGASPVTLVGLIVAKLGGTRYLSKLWPGRMYVAEPDGRCMRFLNRSGAAAFTIGGVIIFRSAVFSPALLRHELRHVEQCSWFGPLWPLACLVFWTWAWARGGDWYRDSWHERDARRAAGEK